MGHAPLPSFERPPVVETVLGVDFEPIEWQIPHFGLFFNALRSDEPTAYPTFQVKGALPSPVEHFEPKLETTRLELLDTPDVRLWYISEDEHDLIQIQRNRFIFNWRKGTGDSDYPRFEGHVLPAFEASYERFRRFLDSEGIGTPKATQCEVTYVNHIPKGEGWDTADDWPGIFNVGQPQASNAFLPATESRGFTATYVIGERNGRLRVRANTALRETDGTEVIVLQLTARGKPESGSDDVYNWLKLGREWIVRGFTDLTTPRMHKIWERVQ